MGTNAEAIHKHHTPVAHCPVSWPHSHVQAHNLTDAPASLQRLSPTHSPFASLPPPTHTHDGLTHIGFYILTAPSHRIRTGLLHTQAHAVAQNRTRWAHTYTRHCHAHWSHYIHSNTPRFLAVSYTPRSLLVCLPEASHSW